MVSRPRPDQPERAIWRILRRIHDLETMVYGRSSSVTNGRTRFIGNESILVEGSGKVSGWWIVTGTLRVVGTLEMLGNMVVNGVTTFVGMMTVNGPWALNGDGDIAGNVTVLPGGKIQVGDIIIDPTISGGAVAFANGAQVFTDGTTIQVYKGNSVMQVSDSYARLQYGGEVISIGSDGVRISGMEARTASSTGLPVGAIGYDGSTIFRVISG